MPSTALFSRPPLTLAACLLCASAGLLCAAPARAAGVEGMVQVNWQSLTLNVIDTRADDGVQAGFQWLWQSTETVAFLDGTGFLPEQDHHADWTSSGGLLASRPLFSAQTAYDGSQLLVTSQAQGGPTSAVRVYRQGRLQFIGEGRIEASIEMQALVSAGTAQQDAWAYADANLFFGRSDWTALSEVAYARADLANGGTAQTLLATALDFRDGDQALLVTQPGVVLQPVPEPGTWALWAAGLCSVGSLIRRRGLRCATRA